jgi:glycosyltransferase involved in cell wall biosynthesis
MAFTSSGTPRVVIVTNIPAPYRNPVYLRLAEKLGYQNLHVVFCASREGNREWVVQQQGFAHTFLKEHSMEWKGRYIHNNPSVIGVLRRLNPDVIVTTGFNPTHLYAFAYAVLTGKVHVPMTDGTLVSERRLSMVHRVVRRMIYRLSRAFVGASHGSARLYADYGIRPEFFFQSHLCANNEAFAPYLLQQRQFDFMFCGRFAPEKNPIFALNVAAGVARALRRKVSMLLVGSGPLLEEARIHAANLAAEVETSFRGFVQQPDLPPLYCSAKVFLFPSSWDPWGVVANEACAAGQAVLVSPLAAVADELIVDGKNGYVMPLSLPAWVERGAGLLQDEQMLMQFSSYSRLRVQSYTYDHAAQGLANAVLAAVGKLSPASEQQQVSEPKRSVVIVQRRLTDYRVPFFERLQEDLQKDGIVLRLLYGDPAASELSKQDSADIPWGEKLPTRYFLGKSICWQPYLSKVRDADLVILSQENKLLCNLWPLFGPRPYRLAFWGHGANMQASLRNLLQERFKRLTTTRVDWWFAYTGLSKEIVARQGFPSEKISNVENSIDTSALQADCAAVGRPDLEQLRSALNLGDGPIGLFIGSLYPEKRLDFLLDAGVQLAQRFPDFRLIVVGDGPLRRVVDQAASEHPWLRYVGRQIGQDKARFLKIASVIMNPGLVGLGILDALVAGVPIVTTDCGLHSPEIAYLCQGKNGFMTADSLKDYVETVERVLSDPALVSQLREYRANNPYRYTIENMAAQFRAGILKALNNAHPACP